MDVKHKSPEGRIVGLGYGKERNSSFWILDKGFKVKFLIDTNSLILMRHSERPMYRIETNANTHNQPRLASAPAKGIGCAPQMWCQAFAIFGFRRWQPSVSGIKIYHIKWAVKQTFSRVASELFLKKTSRKWAVSFVCQSLLTMIQFQFQVFPVPMAK